MLLFPYLIVCASVCHALVTLSTIRNLTTLTVELRSRVLDTGKVGVSPGSSEAGNGQIALGPSSHASGMEDEVEDVVAATLKLLCSSLLLELEKPLDLASSSKPDAKCDSVTDEYHAFLGATVKYLYAVQERQMVWRWGAESAVFDGVGWLQGLWASRRTNSQERSFIEQQIGLYGATTCFKKNEVLRRGVEVVEYLNDIIESFE